MRNIISTIVDQAINDSLPDAGYLRNIISSEGDDFFEFFLGWKVGLRPFELSQYISRRKADFVAGMIDCCYVVFNGEAVAVNAAVQTRRAIEAEIETLKP